MGIIVLCVAFMFTRVDLPEIATPDNENKENESSKAANGTIAAIRHLWSNRTFRFGVLALFFYEVAEISINSLFINYATTDGWMSKSTASIVLSFGALGLFMIARVFGSWIMSRIAAEKVLFFCALMTIVGSLAVTLNAGHLSHAGVFVCYAFEAIMFPTIFAITISRAGRHVKIASSFLMMTPIGGAVGTFLMGYTADITSMSTAFVVPAVGYACVMLYSLYALKLKKNV